MTKIGTKIVAPNIATMCCRPKSSILPVPKVRASTIGSPLKSLIISLSIWFFIIDTAKEILDKQINAITKKLHDENRVELTIEDDAINTLVAKAFNNLENGGRGVGNVVEKLLLNPLAAYLLDNDLITDSIIIINKIICDKDTVSLEIRGDKK